MPTFTYKKNTLFGIEELNNWVYFVHSYHAIPDDLNIIAAQVDYGSEKLTAMIENENLLACQFHPEKSGKTGEKLLRRWLSNCLLYTSPSPRDLGKSRMPSSA